MRHRDASSGVLRRNRSGHQPQPRAVSLCCCFTPKCGAIAAEKRVTQRVAHSTQRWGEARGQTSARPGLSLPSLQRRPWSRAAVVERECAASAGRCRRRREPGADVATASGGTDPAPATTAAPSRDPPRRAFENAAPCAGGVRSSLDGTQSTSEPACQCQLVRLLFC